MSSSLPAAPEQGKAKMRAEPPEKRAARLDPMDHLRQQGETGARRIKTACSMVAAGKRRLCCVDRSGFYVLKLLVFLTRGRKFNSAFSFPQRCEVGARAYGRLHVLHGNPFERTK